MNKTLQQHALAVLCATSPADKIEAAEAALHVLKDGAQLGPSLKCPELPGRPEKPALLPPKDVPRRRLGSVEGRVALLHAIAHIEFNAIDLAFDMALRFSGEVDEMGLNQLNFINDWFEVGADEARHFGLINDRLGQMGATYGDLPAHAGLWDAALKTRENILARLVVAPLILEARGLDVTPGMIEKLERAGDTASADCLKIIYQDEIGHVACGEQWFHEICITKGLGAKETFQSLQGEYFVGGLKPPFNHKARDKAGLPRAYYERF